MMIPRQQRRKKGATSGTADIKPESGRQALKLRRLFVVDTNAIMSTFQLLDSVVSISTTVFRTSAQQAYCGGRRKHVICRGMTSPQANSVAA